MKPLLTFVFLSFLPGALVAQSANDSADPMVDEVFLGDGVENLTEFVWVKRPIIVFADSPADPRFIQQMEFLNARPDDLAERDIVVLTDTDPAANSALRDRLHPRGFMLVLIGKDGTIYLRKPLPWDVREISRSVDKMPMRQQEVRDRRGDS